jgi:hypothetical protein
MFGVMLMWEKLLSFVKFPSRKVCKDKLLISSSFLIFTLSVTLYFNTYLLYSIITRILLYHPKVCVTREQTALRHREVRHWKLVLGFTMMWCPTGNYARSITQFTIFMSSRVFVNQWISKEWMNQDSHIILMNVNSEKLEQILLTFVHFVHFDEVAWRQSSLLLDFKFN